MMASLGAVEIGWRIFDNLFIILIVFRFHANQQTMYPAFWHTYTYAKKHMFFDSMAQNKISVGISI